MSEIRFQTFGDTVNAQYENDGKSCRGYENCEWHKMSCQGVSAGLPGGPCKQNSLRSDALSTLKKWAAMAKQIILHRNTEAIMANF